MSEAPEKARLPFPVGHDDLALRNATEEEPPLLGIERDAFRNQFGVLETERDPGGRCLRFLIGELLANRLELCVVPDCIEPGIAHGNEPKLATLQAAQKLNRSLALTEIDARDRFVKHEQAVTRPFFPQILNALQARARRGRRFVSCV